LLPEQEFRQFEYVVTVPKGASHETLFPLNVVFLVPISVVVFRAAA
jgi:hypothetical protein